MNLTGFTSRVAAAIAGEDPELVLPLMEGLQGDLLAREDHAAELLSVRLHSFDAAVEHALREWERASRWPRARERPRRAATVWRARARARADHMSLVTASIQIDATPAQVWEMVMDPNCLADWVTIHRRLVRADDGPPRVGFTMDQQLQLRGVHLEVHWRLVECRPCELAVWEGRGPARSRARTEYLLSAEDGGTRFDYRNEFRRPARPGRRTRQPRAGRRHARARGTSHTRAATRSPRAGTRGELV